MNNAMTFIEKVKTLLESRRFLLWIGQAVGAVLAIAFVVLPILGREAPEGIPTDPEVLADYFGPAAESVAALLGAVIVILQVLGNWSELIKSYTVRPPGVKDREGTGPDTRLMLNLDELVEAAVERRLSGGYIQNRQSRAEREDD